MSSEVLIIGAGLAGLAAGWRTASHKCRVRVITKGWGGTHWGSGCVGILGYLPSNPKNEVESPEKGLLTLIQNNPKHPYAIAGLEVISKSLDAFKALCTAAGYPLHGSLEDNWLLPSAVGAARPTCLAPEMMIEGDLRRCDPMLLVGLEVCLDFCAGLAADNLEARGIPARHVTLDLPRLRDRKVMNSVILARLFEDAALREEVAANLKPNLGQAARVGFPAVLGLRNALQVKRDLEERLQRPVFEIPILPPSIPGTRLHRILVDAIHAGGGQVLNGMQAVGFDAEENQVAAVWSEAAARKKKHGGNQFVLATGGILGDGIEADYEGQVREVVFNLPVWVAAKRENWFRQDFLDLSGHPVFQSGLEVDAGFRPVNANAQPLYSNLMAIGTGLGHCDVLQERSFEGVALATGYAAGESVGQ